jgi:hypothetical protein
VLLNRVLDETNRLTVPWSPRAAQSDYAHGHKFSRVLGTIHEPSSPIDRERDAWHPAAALHEELQRPRRRSGGCSTSPIGY